VGKGVKIISELSEKDMDPGEADKILKNYSFLKRLDFLNQVIFNATTSILPSDKKKLAMLAYQMSFENVDTFQQNLNEVMKSNKLFFQKHLAAN
jgi:glutamine synthetase adenylyltransferase